MGEERPESEGKRPLGGRRGVGWPIWLLIAAFCGFLEFAGAFATDNRIHGWGDVAFVAVVAVVGAVALVEALVAFYLWLQRRKVRRSRGEVSDRTPLPPRE